VPQRQFKLFLPFAVYLCGSFKHKAKDSINSVKQLHLQLGPLEGEIANSYSRFQAFRVFDDSGFERKLRAVPEDEEGLDVTFLRTAIKKSEQEAISNGNNKPVYYTDELYVRLY
jgi:hypothetical protein